MIFQSEIVLKILDEFNEKIAKSQNLAIFSRDIELQKQEVEDLTSFISILNDVKTNGVNSMNEDELNFILCLMMSAETILFELNMLVALKENKMDLAWNNLINAQNLVSIVIKNHPINGSYLDNYNYRLEAYERILFPRMMFGSTGGIVKRSRCSICKEDYEECDHMKGKMYKGELCVREILEIELEEVSLVENPANKLCRQISIKMNDK